LLTHVTLGSNDIGRSRAFYDRVMGALGLKRLDGMDGEIHSMWGTDRPSIVIRHPLNGGAATFANGGTVGFAAPDRAAVDAFHAEALANGGSCEGPPGPREAAGGLYGAYVRDPDGNKMCAYSYTQE
jgi:catechol 2,3-dioxygenase-like lactoylglutathione lyase family enzyme